MRLFHQSVIVASLLAGLALVFHPTPARAATGPGTGGGGSVTGITVLPPLVLSGTQVQLPQRISQLNTNYAFTNASSRDFYQSGGNLYSKNLSLNHRWVYYDDFNTPMTTPGVFPDAPTGHKYNVFTGGGGNTNKINLVDGKWWLGETGAVYQSVTFGTNGVYGSAAPVNTWGGTFSYHKSTNNTADGYVQNAYFVLSPQVDFLASTYLHVTVGANVFVVSRELSSTNLIYAPHFGGRYLGFETNHSFTLTIISNNIIADIAGMRYVGYDESLSTVYNNLKVATWEVLGSPTNSFWPKWDSQYAGYVDSEAYWQYAGPFAVRSNGTLQQITFNDRTESRYQLKHESDLFQLYDAISGEILFSADDAAQNVQVGGASSGNVNIIRPLIYTSGTPGTGKVLTDTDGSGTAVWQTPSGGGSTQMVVAAIGTLVVTNDVSVLGDGSTTPLITLSSPNGASFGLSVNTNLTVQTTNKFDFSSPSVGQVIAAHSSSDGQIVWTNATVSSGPSTNCFPYTVPITGTNFIVDWLALGPTNTVILTNYANAGLIQTNIGYFKERLVMIVPQGSQGFNTLAVNTTVPNQRFTLTQTGITQDTNGGYYSLLVWIPVNTNAVLSGQNWGIAP